ncbi:MAG: rod shape-determining protein MreC [Firmicutes bacterium HGW-Firmicutes-8]|nr:MAG: rod shape-determining protein MreC [Firmicutes bacterium HGW-Firmicutes-8]
MLRYLINRYVLGFFAIVVLALVLISYTGQDRPALTPVEKIIKGVVTPLESGVTRVLNSIGDAVGSVFTIGSIKEENKNLKQRVSTLESENLLLKEYEYQNLRLRELLIFKDTVSRSYETVYASVVALNPSNTDKTVTINRGENDGVRKNMAVVTSLGLVGHVINVSGNSAEVMLIVDKNSAVGGLVQITRTPGIIEGEGNNSGYLKMTHISKEAPVREKQVVVSSGLGGVFPKGLPVGRTTKIEIESNGLEKYAVIRPFVDFNRLEEVMVIKTVFVGNELSPSAGGG